MQDTPTHRIHAPVLALLRAAEPLDFEGFDQAGLDQLANALDDVTAEGLRKVARILGVLLMRSAEVQAERHGVAIARVGTRQQHTHVPQADTEFCRDCGEAMPGGASTVDPDATARELPYDTTGGPEAPTLNEMAMVFDEEHRAFAGQSVEALVDDLLVMVEHPDQRPGLLFRVRAHLDMLSPTAVRDLQMHLVFVLGDERALEVVEWFTAMPARAETPAH